MGSDQWYASRLAPAHKIQSTNFQELGKPVFKQSLSKIKLCKVTLTLDFNLQLNPALSTQGSPCGWPWQYVTWWWVHPSVDSWTFPWAWALPGQGSLPISKPSSCYGESSLVLFYFCLGVLIGNVILRSSFVWGLALFLKIFLSYFHIFSKIPASGESIQPLKRPGCWLPSLTLTLTVTPNPIL